MIQPIVVNRIVSHMNNDHADAVVLYVKAFSEQTQCDKAKLLNIDEAGMDIEYVLSDVAHQVRILFEPPLKDGAEAHTRLVAMVGEAREKLGVVAES